MLTYLLLLNTITFIIYAIDKHRARRAARRIPEKHLLWLAALGGAWGAWLAITTLRHKTRHPRFTITIPLLSALWIFLTLLCIFM